MNWFQSALNYIRVSEKAPAPTLERERPPAAVVRPKGRPSYDQGNLSLLNNPWSRINPTQNFALYAAIREVCPIVDAAIVKKRQLIGCPIIDAAPDTKREVELWLASLRVNGLQRGLEMFLGTFADNGLHFGRAHAEIILNNERTDVWGIQQLHPKTIHLRPHPDRVSIEVVQNQPFGGEPQAIPTLLQLNYIHEVRGDDPNGTSLLWGLPFVAEIMQKLLKNLGSTWDRFGTPRYHINWEPPEDFDDPQGAIADEILSDLATQFNSSLESGVKGDIVDFYTSGKVTVTIIGAEGESLAVEMPMRTVAEQVVTRTGLPPFAFGLHWSPGEQLTQLQADLLRTDIATHRGELTPELAYLIDYRQRLTGGDRNVRLLWPEPTLIDVFAKTRADFFRQNALEIQMRNLVMQWRQGAVDAYDFVRATRPEISHLSNDEIDDRLPNLKKEPPELEADPATGAGRTGTGGGGGLGPGSANSANYLMDQLKDGEIYNPRKALSNGKH